MMFRGILERTSFIKMQWKEFNNNSLKKNTQGY